LLLPLRCRHRTVEVDVTVSDWIALIQAALLAAAAYFAWRGYRLSLSEHREAREAAAKEPLLDLVGDVIRELKELAAQAEERVPGVGIQRLDLITARQRRLARRRGKADQRPGTRAAARTRSQGQQADRDHDGAHAGAQARKVLARRRLARARRVVRRARMLLRDLLLDRLHHDLVGAALRRTQMADQLDPVDPKAPLEIRENGFSLARPTAKWVRARKGFQSLPVQPLLRNDALLLLVQPDLYAFLDVQSEANNQVGPAVEEFILNRLKQDPTQPALNNDKVKSPPKFGGIGDDDDPPEISRITKVIAVGTPKSLPTDDKAQQANEMTAEATIDGKRWTVLVRTYQMKKSGRLFIVRAFAETARFARVKDELVKALDSFKVSPGS